MKKAFMTMLITVPLFAQQLSPIQTAVINDDASAVQLLSAQGEDWLFVRKPSKTVEAELLLDFALANGKLSAYNTLIAKGALPGITTVFTAVKSGNYILARQLVEAGRFAVYGAAPPSIPRYIISNILQTNISAHFFTNTFTNVSQFAVTNALGELTLREYTNVVGNYATNFFTNITAKVVTNSFQTPQEPVGADINPSISYITLTNVAPAPITNYKDQIYTYIFTNDKGESAEKTITNIVPKVSEILTTNITRRPITNIPSAPDVTADKSYVIKYVTLSRLNFIDLARLSESQGSKENSTYFLEKANALK